MRILLTGGSACGKSTFAEALCMEFPMPRYYIATMRPYDDECLAKIARHRAQRAEKGFETLEKHTDLQEICLPQRGTALLECMCNLTANEMFREDGTMVACYDKIFNAIVSLENQCENLIVVTNEVGSDGNDYAAGTKAYIDTLGRLNQALAQRFDTVAELVCGIPILLKGELP